MVGPAEEPMSIASFVTTQIITRRRNPGPRVHPADAALNTQSLYSVD